jgi:hypothetical protein
MQCAFVRSSFHCKVQESAEDMLDDLLGNKSPRSRAVACQLRILSDMDEYDAKTWTANKGTLVQLRNLD